MADLVQVEPDLKFAQLDAIEFDGFRGDRQLVRLEVDLDIAELAFQGPQIQEDRRCAGREPGLRTRCHGA